MKDLTTLIVWWITISIVSAMIFVLPNKPYGAKWVLIFALLIFTYKIYPFLK